MQSEIVNAVLPFLIFFCKHRRDVFVGHVVVITSVNMTSNGGTDRRAFAVGALHRTGDPPVASKTNTRKKKQAADGESEKLLSDGQLHNSSVLRIDSVSLALVSCVRDKSCGAPGG